MANFAIIGIVRDAIWRPRFPSLPRRLAVIADASHFALFSQPQKVIPLIEHFLNEPEKRIPLAIGSIGYDPGDSK